MLFLLAFILGLFIGSFLGVVIDRLPEGKSIVKGRSICDHCKHKLGILDLFPLLSFILLKRRCRYCNHKLSLFYPVIEIITGIIFASMFYLIYNPLLVFNLMFLLYILYLYLMLSSFIAIFFIDLKKGIIPNSIIIFDIVITVIWLIISPIQVFINHFLSGIGAFLFFLIVSYLFLKLTKKEGMGGGDIKLAFVLGLFMGFPSIVSTLYVAFVGGAIISLILLISRVKNFKGSLPFGPFLILALLVNIFFNYQINLILFKLIGY